MTRLDSPLPSTAPSDRVRVLLVDDHEIVRRGVASVIAAEPNLQVCGEADGVQSAIEAIKRTDPQLVIVDMSLRDGDGLELLKYMRDNHPRILSLVLSMHDEEVYAERALRAGARGYVRKVDVAETIIGAIARVLRGEVYVSEAVATGMLQRLSLGKRSQDKGTVDLLSDRELQVLRCIGRGLSNKEIAEALYISVKTVESHREHIRQKLALQSSSDLLRYAIEFSRLG
jgi:DNA-binding NarL/FixJ family response regulator